MASVTDFTNMPSGNISAYGDIAKMLLSLNPIVSGVLIAVSAITTVYLKRNNKITKTNTEANEAIAPLVEQHKLAMESAQNQMVKTVQEFNQTVAKSQAELIAEITKVKIVVAKVNQLTTDKLSGIPKVQDAIDKLTAKVTEHEESFKLIKARAEELKKRSST